MIPPDGLLVCPACRDGLVAAHGALRCESGHTYDIARQGYVNLLPGGARAGTADTAAMVAERAAFLAAGHYAPLADVVSADVARLAGHVTGSVLEVGAGTGYYLARALAAAPGRIGVALDLSKHAVRRAMGAHPRIVGAVCDAWGTLPVHDGSVAVLLDVFAPRNPAEFARVLAPGGALVTVTPTPAHLAELVERLGLIAVDARKHERLEAGLGGTFGRVSTQPVTYPLSLSRADALRLALMGPSAHHRDREELADALDISPEPLGTTVAVEVVVWRRGRR